MGLYKLMLMANLSSLILILNLILNLIIEFNINIYINLRYS